MSKKSEINLRIYDFLPDFELWEQIYLLKTNGYSFRTVANILDLDRRTVTNCWKRWVFRQPYLFQNNINYLSRVHPQTWDALNNLRDTAIQPLQDADMRLDIE